MTTVAATKSNTIAAPKAVAPAPAAAAPANKPAGDQLHLTKPVKATAAAESSGSNNTILALALGIGSFFVSNMKFQGAWIVGLAMGLACTVIGVMGLAKK